VVGGWKIDSPPARVESLSSLERIAKQVAARTGAAATRRDVLERGMVEPTAVERTAEQLPALKTKPVLKKKVAEGSGSQVCEEAADLGMEVFERRGNPSEIERSATPLPGLKSKPVLEKKVEEKCAPLIIERSTFYEPEPFKATRSNYRFELIEATPEPPAIEGTSIPLPELKSKPVLEKRIEEEDCPLIITRSSTRRFERREKTSEPPAFERTSVPLPHLEGKPVLKKKKFEDEAVLHFAGDCPRVDSTGKLVRTGLPEKLAWRGVAHYGSWWSQPVKQGAGEINGEMEIAEIPETPPQDAAAVPPLHERLVEQTPTPTEASPSCPISTHNFVEHRMSGRKAHAVAVTSSGFILLTRSILL
jgi:hypothetical protein